MASYLIGLESELHASRDPLRGNLFENMVIIEALKYRLHRGKRSNLCFYRDSCGNEVDMIVTIGPNLFPVEIKAGETITEDFFKGLRSFKKTFPKNTPFSSGLVYGGDLIQRRSDVMIYPVTGAHTMLASVENE